MGMRPGNAVTIFKYMMRSSRGWVYAALGFTLLFPVLWLVLLRVVGNPSYMNYFITGTVVNTSFLTPFIASSQDIAYMRHGSRVYSLLFSNGAGHWDIALGYVMQVMPFILPSVASIMLFSIALMRATYGITQVAVTILVAAVISVSSAILGYALGISIRNFRVVNQLSQVVPWPLMLLAPVYYPISILPPILRLISLALPTTYMALAINGSLSMDTSELVRGLLGLLVYSSASIIIARYAIAKGEVNG